MAEITRLFRRTGTRSVLACRYDQTIRPMQQKTKVRLSASKDRNEKSDAKIEGILSKKTHNKHSPSGLSQIDLKSSRSFLKGRSYRIKRIDNATVMANTDRPSTNAGMESPRRMAIEAGIEVKRCACHITSIVLR